MQSIRKRISRPYMFIIILIPLTTIILFNLIVSYSSKEKATKDLKQAVLEITQNIQKDNMQNILSLIKNQSHTNSAELILFNNNGELTKLFDLRESFITQELAHLAYQEVKSLTQGEIGSFRYYNDVYYVAGVDYEKKMRTDKVVYISKGLILDDFVKTVNLVLIFISTIITVLALFISNKVTNSVAQPIERLTSVVENIKSDELIIIDDTSNSLELQKLTSEINLLNRRIYYFNQSQKTFLHNASHELRTPLMSIQGYADGIEMGIFEDARGTAHLISNQSKRLTKLVDSLLLLARAENFHARKKLERVNLSDCLLALIDEYNGYAFSNNINISSDLIQNVYVNSNIELLQGCIGNIISNAIRYAKTHVYISLMLKDDTATVTVKDDGNGVSNVDKIFDKFIKGEDGNFGLGLSIAKTSADIMNAKIKIDNDNGAVFQVIIPKC